MHDILKVVDFISKKSKKEKKISCFFIGNTSKNYKKSYYLTTVRENKNFIFSSVIVYSDFIVKKISKIIDGNIDFILVDSEKKILSKKKNFLFNIERTVKENIFKSQIRIYKGNDLTALSVATFINNYFIGDIKGVGGKKVIILGAGNIGFKLGLMLVESGAHVDLYRRDKKKLKAIVNAINIIKPIATVSNCYFLKEIPSDLSKYDIILTASNGSKIIDFKKIKNCSKNNLLIDIGKENFSEKAITNLRKKNVNIFRTDITSSYLSYLDNIFYTEKNFKKNNNILKIKNYHFINVGTLGKKGDIIVNDTNKPKVIYGVCDGNGGIKKLNDVKKKILLKEIFLNSNLILKYE
jgi:hypothetical protein